MKDIAHFGVGVGVAGGRVIVAQTGQAPGVRTGCSDVGQTKGVRQWVGSGPPKGVDVIVGVAKGGVGVALACGLGVAQIGHELGG